MSLEERLCLAMGATAARPVARIQELWSGWGQITRFALVDGPAPTVIVKQVQPPTEDRHPLGWTSSASDLRKVRSYEVELAFYRDFGPRLPAAVRVPQALHLEPGLFVLEDLDAVGFAGRAVGPGSLGRQRVARCLKWLAGLHARFVGVDPVGLWPCGTYWHLDTRPDELAAMQPGPLRQAAHAIDAALSATAFPTVLHGDAKVANFCFGDGGVAAVDFQYAGGGCGMKDVAYFLGSCLGDASLYLHADRWLALYFSTLRRALPDHVDGGALEADWRALWPLAWADFERFLAGWAPYHWKRHGYAADVTAEALRRL